jgi:broad specificity phosphatase PhoE
MLICPTIRGIIYDMVRLILIRHAATEASEKKLLLGSTDTGVSSAGLEQLERLSALVEPYKPGSWYCSSMQRAVQTVEKLKSCGVIDQQCIVDERLKEIDFGRWEQKSFTEIELSDPDLIQAWSQYDDFVFPGGEAVAAFAGRVAEMLDVFRSAGEKQIGIVTHGGVIRNMICLSLGISTRNYLLFSVNPASLTIIDLYPEGGVLAGLNM